ncbi:MAG: transporter substrate-binding domain-containing protein [Sulfitobacter sp.]
MPVVFRFFFAASLLFVSSFAGCVLSAEPEAKRPVLRAVYGEFYPYGFTGSDGNAQGYNIDITRQLADRAGYDVRFIPAENPQQFLEILERGEADLTSFLALTPQRLAAGLATSSLGAYVLSVYVRQDSDTVDIGALSGARIGVVVGSVSQTAAEMLPDVNMVEFRTSDGLLLPLLRGEVDAVVEVAETFEARLRSSFLEDKVRRLKPPLAITPYGIIVRRDLPEVHARIEARVVMQATADLVEEAREEWFGQDRSIVEHPWFGNVVMIVGGIALTTLALGIYAFRLRRRSVMLAAEFGANQLLIDAFDQMRAAIAIFDVDMKAVHWNGGFAARFPEILATLRGRGTLEEVCIAFHRTGIIASDTNDRWIDALAARTARKLKEGDDDQRTVLTRDGHSFDLSMFPLGTRYYAAIWVDMTEVHSQQKLLADQSSELMRKNQQLEAFTAMAAHDLKAPLVQQKALMEFIAEDLIDAKLSLPPEAKTYFTTLSDLSCRMSLLVSDLLEYAKAELDQGETICFMPNARLEGIIQLAAPKSQMTIVVMPDIPAVKVDPTCFDMVMRNLITNAAKHHDKSAGTITVRGYLEGGNVIIEVEDDGPGIRPTDEAKVFEPFARLTNVEGTGLGLAFVKRTVTVWGGSISLRAASVRGTIFSVRVPAALDAIVPMAGAIAPTISYKLGDTLH